MKQQPLPGFDPAPEPIVNVAHVPHRSPFRYPGGKTWLVPRIRRWLNRAAQPPHLIEPFAGGAIVGLTAAFEGLAAHVTLVELDADIAAVWETIITQGEGPRLAEAVRRFEMTGDHVDALLAHPPDDTLTHALQTIVRNRVNRGGILAPGAGRLKDGENGRGLLSRWYPETLARRITALHALRSRLTFIHGDGLAIMREQTEAADTVFFVDPPYTAPGKRAGSRLYRHADLNHEQLFAVAQGVRGDVLLTYDNTPAVVDLAARHGFQTREVAMKTTHHARLNELLIGRDLRWLA